LIEKENSILSVNKILRGFLVSVTTFYPLHRLYTVSWEDGRTWKKSHHLFEGTTQAFAYEQLHVREDICVFRPTCAMWTLIARPSSYQRSCQASLSVQSLWLSW